MVDYIEEDLFSFPRERIWTLLSAHTDDATISRIHPLIRSQKTVGRTDEEFVLRRSIDVRGKLMTSDWKVTYRPPEFARWEIISGEGPWDVGSFVENRYDPAPGGTRIQTRVSARIGVLPFFIPQKAAIRRVLGTVDREDRAFLRT